MDMVNSVLNVVVPPESLVMMAFAWPALRFISACEWLYYSFFSELIGDKVDIITGASSGIGEVQCRVDNNEWCISREQVCEVAKLARHISSVQSICTECSQLDIPHANRWQPQRQEDFPHRPREAFP